MSRHHNIIQTPRPRAQRRVGQGLIVLAALFLCAADLAAASIEALRSILAEHNVSVPETELKTSLEEAFIRAVDPGAHILPAESTQPGAASERPALATVEHLPGNILYLPVTSLNGQAAGDVRTALTDWTHAPHKGIILDLRNAGGADLADVDALAGVLLPSGETLYTVVDGQEEILETHATSGSSTNATLLPPCILLIGTNTQDAAEILASCLVERRGIMLMGAPTAGRAALRDALPLPDGRVLRIATRWVVPFERPAFQGTGVIPHLEVDAAYHHGHPPPPSASAASRRRPLSAKAKLQRQLRKRVADDAVLGRAADLLLSLKALRHRDSADDGKTSPASAR